MNPYIASLPNIFKQNPHNKIKVMGWVKVRRDHGGLIFIDLRDSTAILQLVFRPSNKVLFEVANQLRNEWVIEVEGLLKQRSSELENPKIITGKFELVVEALRILNKSQTLPINIDDNEPLASEDKRLKYRYLDLRRPCMQRNLKLRAQLYKVIRKFLEARDFTEVPTPILANSSPEGARDFLVPSRVHPGKFYALPQAPQQFKQLLMVGGLARYYQIAPVFRDEDPRADRLYGDFYQLDLEMAFVEDGRVIRQMFTPLIESLIKEFAHLQLFQDCFQEMTYKEAISNYGTDKPDLRFEMKLIELNDVFAETGVEILKSVLAKQGLIKGLLAPAILSRRQIDELTKLVQEFGAAGLAYLNYTEGEWQGPLRKFLKEAELEQLKQVFDIQSGQTVFWIADVSEKTVYQTLAQLRSRLGDILNLKDPQSVAAVWVTEFPFYEEDEQTKKLVFAHNPFSKPIGDLNQADKLKITADQFDLVLNGYEICSGAVRNHDPRVLTEAFQQLDYDLVLINTQFGALINAFKYGAPPHAGCAFGLDRLLMILAKESNIRELVAFPKNGSGVDVMMGSPAPITPLQRKELGL